MSFCCTGSLMGWLNNALTLLFVEDAPPNLMIEEIYPEHRGLITIN